MFKMSRKNKNSPRIIWFLLTQQNWKNRTTLKLKTLYVPKQTLPLMTCLSFKMRPKNTTSPAFSNLTVSFFDSLMKISSGLGTIWILIEFGVYNPIILKLIFMGKRWSQPLIWRNQLIIITTTNFNLILVWKVFKHISRYNNQMRHFLSQKKTFSHLLMIGKTFCLSLIRHGYLKLMFIIFLCKILRL